MKADRYARDVFKKLESFHNNYCESNNIDGKDDDEDDYYIRTGTIPPRFKAYRHARWEKLDEWGKLICEDVDETITFDELEFGLKRWLSKSPEERYQEEREDRYSHDKGCHNGQCIPTCRFYPEHGRIENEEVIRRYKEIVERYKQKNAIVEPPSPSEMVRLLNEVTAYLPTTD